MRLGTTELPANYPAGNQIADTKTGVYYGITSHLMPKTVGTTKVIWNGTVKTFTNLNVQYRSLPIP